MKKKLLNEDDALSSLPNFFLGAVREQIYNGMLPQEIVEKLFKPILENYNNFEQYIVSCTSGKKKKEIKSLTEKLQYLKNELEDILGNYNDLAKKYDIPERMLYIKKINYLHRVLSSLKGMEMVCGVTPEEEVEKLFKPILENYHQLELFYEEVLLYDNSITMKLLTDMKRKCGAIMMHYKPIRDRYNIPDLFKRED